MAAFEQLVEELERSHREAQERMSDPSVYNDHREAAEVGRRLKELEQPTKVAREWRQIRGDLEAAYERICQVCSTGILSQVLPTLAEAASRDPELATVHKDFVSRRRRHLVAALERAAERGELRPGLDLSIVADLVAGPMFYKKLVHHERPDDAYAKVLLDLVLTAIT